MNWQTRRARARRTPPAIAMAKKQKSRDSASSYDLCRVCGEHVVFGTNGNGGLIVLERGSLRPHRHQMPEA